MFIITTLLATPATDATVSFIAVEIIAIHISRWTRSYTFLRSVVCLSVRLCLSSVSNIQAPGSSSFDGFSCHRVIEVVEVHVHTKTGQMRVPDPQVKERFRGQPQPKHAIASPMLPPGEYKRRAIPPFANYFGSTNCSSLCKEQ